MRLKENPKISVVIPALNEEKRLPLCLKSLKNQAFKEPYEIIVVDNNSIDKTSKIAKSFGAKVIFEPKKGTCQARQTGTLAAQGEIIAGTDADCIVPSWWLSKIFKKINQDKEVVAIGGRVEYESNAPLWLKVGNLIKDKALLTFFLLFRKAPHISSANFSFRKKAFLKIGGYRTFFTTGGDQQDILFRLQKIGDVLIEPEIVIKTSARRYQKGFFYTLFIEGLWFGALNYFYTLFFHRSLIDQTIDIRE